MHHRGLLRDEDSYRGFALNISNSRNYTAASRRYNSASNLESSFTPVDAGCSIATRSALPDV